MEYTVEEIIMPDTDEIVVYITKFDDFGAVTFIQDEENPHYQEYLKWKAEQEG